GVNINNTTVGTTNIGNGGAGSFINIGTDASQTDIGDRALVNIWGINAAQNGFGNSSNGTNMTNTYGQANNNGNITNNFVRRTGLGTVTNNIGDAGIVSKNIGNKSATNTTIGLT